MITLVTLMILVPSARGQDRLRARLAAADLCVVTAPGSVARVECYDRDGSRVFDETWAVPEAQFTARLLGAQFRLTGRDSGPPRLYFQR